MLKEIEERQSIRTFSDKKISDADLKEILKAGQLAPSWINVQPWHFIVVKDKQLREEVNKLCMSQKHVIDASDIILVIADVSAWSAENFGNVLKQNPRFQTIINDIVTSPAYNPSLQSEELAKIRTCEQCAYAIENIILQAQNLGISSCIIGAASNEFTNTNPQQYQKVKDMLKLKKDMYIFNAVVLGYDCADKKPVRLRKDFDQIVSKDFLGNKF